MTSNGCFLNKHGIKTGEDVIVGGIEVVDKHIHDLERMSLVAVADVVILYDWFVDCSIMIL